ncbi:MAG: hypothetical protein QM692_13550 [Thermomicrobiales bacterium]
MDQTRFDELARGLAQPTGRRRALGVLLGGGLAVAVAGLPASAARKRKRRNRKNAAADGNDQTLELPPGTLAGGIWDETLEICQYNAETGGYDVVAVSTVLAPQYLNGGATLYIDCCTDSECGALPCLEPTSCVQGACAYDVVEGAPCALSDGSTGYCDSNAQCNAAVYAPPAPAPEPDYDAGYVEDTASGYDAGVAPATGSAYDAAPDTGYDPSWDAGYDPNAEPGY